MTTAGGRQQVRVEDFEGLVFTTARMIAGVVDEDEDDIRQILRIKAWKALGTYDPAKATQTPQKYVFMCVRNQVKDLLKRKKRPEVFIEDKAPSGDPVRRESWELDNLSVDAELAFACVEEEELPLPSTLTLLERRVAVLLVAEFNQTEVARLLSVSRTKVRQAHEQIVVKMADWKPTAATVEDGRTALQAAA